MARVTHVSPAAIDARLAAARAISDAWGDAEWATAEAAVDRLTADPTKTYTASVLGRAVRCSTTHASRIIDWGVASCYIRPGPARGAWTRFSGYGPAATGAEKVAAARAYAAAR